LRALEQAINKPRIGIIKRLSARIKHITGN